jgi:hypothetical protein
MNNLSDLINFILTSPHSSMVNIPYDFMGNEQTTLTIINKLVRLGLVTDNNANYKIQVKANIVELEHLRDEFNYDLTLYENRNKNTINTLNVGGDVNGSQLVQGLRLGNFDSSQSSNARVKVDVSVNPKEEPKTIHKKLSIFQRFYKRTMI